METIKRTLEYPKISGALKNILIKVMQAEYERYETIIPATGVLPLKGEELD